MLPSNILPKNLLLCSRSLKSHLHKPINKGSSGETCHKIRNAWAQWDSLLPHTAWQPLTHSAPAHMFSITNERFLSELKLFYTAGGEKTLEEANVWLPCSWTLRKRAALSSEHVQFKEGESVEILEKWNCFLCQFWISVIAPFKIVKSKLHLRTTWGVFKLWTLWSMVSSGHLRQHRTAHILLFPGFKQSKQGSSKGSLRNSKGNELKECCSFFD